MLSLHIGSASVLVLILTLSFALGSSKDEENKIEAFVKAMRSSMEVPWIDRIDSVIRDSEDSCTAEIAAASAAFSAQETWAIEMFDASTKIQSGILKGNVRNLGMYDQCVNTNGEYNGTSVQGQHCLVMFDMLTSSVCVPSSCNETQLVVILNSMIQNVSFLADLGIEISRASCARLGNEDFTIGEILTLTFFAAIGTFVVLCTICEFVKIQRPAGVSPVVTGLAKFSLYTNAMAVLSTKVNPRMLPAIQGMRFISMCWIVLGHRFGNTLMRPMVNTLDMVEWFDTWTALYIQMTPFAVDTFFVISGFLMAYLFLKSNKAAKISDIPMMYVHRYLRLTPCLAILVLFTAVLLHRVSNGPMWITTLILHVERCRKDWWVNLLYLQNFVRTDEMCLQHTWYLAVDMQLFLISPFILYPLRRWPKWGLGLLCLLLVGSVVTPTVILAVNGYTMASDPFAQLSGETTIPANKTENHFYNRACPYLVGMLLGFLTANKERHLNKVTVAINWVVTCILMLFCGWATRRLQDTSLDYNLAWETTCALLLRPFWAISIAWIVYACSFGYGGAVARLLSLPIFLPLSRLTYGIYLSHFLIQGIIITSVQTAGRFTDFLLINDFWGDLVLSIVAAFILTLFIESPIIVVEKMLKNRGRKQSPILESKKDVEGGIDNKGMKET